MVVRELINKVVFSVTGVKEAEAAVQQVKNQITRSEAAGTKASASLTGGMAKVGQSATNSAASINKIGQASMQAATVTTTSMSNVSKSATAAANAIGKIGQASRTAASATTASIAGTARTANTAAVAAGNIGTQSQLSSVKAARGMALVSRAAALASVGIRRIGQSSAVTAVTGSRQMTTLRTNISAVGNAAVVAGAKIKSMAAARIPGSLGGSKEPTDGGGFGLPGMGKVMAVVGAFSGAAAIKDTADEVMNLDGRLRAVTQTDEERLAIENQIYELAQKDRQSMTAMGDLYTKVARAGNKMGYSQEQNLRVTDIVSKALTAGGASTAESQSTILQLGQALQSGTLQGDELASLRENGGTLMEHMANAMGVSIADLKEMGAQGELTSDKVMDAILAAGGAIDDEFAKMPMTIGQAFTKIGNGWDKLIMEIERRSGIFSTIANKISDGFETAANYLSVLDQLHSGEATGDSSISELAAQYPLLNQIATEVLPPMKTVFDGIMETVGVIAHYWNEWGMNETIVGLLSTVAQGIAQVWQAAQPLVDLIAIGLVGALKIVATLFDKAFGLAAELISGALGVLGTFIEDLKTAANWLSKIASIGGNSLVDEAMERYGNASTSTTYDNSSRSMTFQVNSKEQAYDYAERFGGYAELDPGV